MDTARGQIRLRAPRENGAVVAEPPLAEAGALIARNRQRLGQLPGGLLGRPWAELRRQAIQEALAAAQAYLQHAGEPLPERCQTSLLLAGHQPELFHPGVWVKDFALHGLAARHQATPINLIVDNDTAKATALRVPAPAADDVLAYHIASIPFDRWSGEAPYEERAVRDESLFASLPERVRPLTRGWGFVPLLEGFWRDVLTQTGRTSLLGERLVAGRRALERRWGCHNLELPVSALCRTDSFAWFTCHVLMNLQRFHGIYNACVQDYRKRYGIRSRNHPVPELARLADWLEVPFWAWRTGQQERRRLFARPSANGIELRAGEDAWPTLPCGTDRETAALVVAWRDLEQRGLKVRSRALTNTLFARIFIADLFMHGIGGGKYDELTDEIIRRFYGIEPPGFLVLSATLLLPLPAYPSRPEDAQDLARRLRDLCYNPQRHLDGQGHTAGAVHDLVSQKQAWISRRPVTAAERRERFQLLRQLTEKLRPFVAGQEAEIRQHLLRSERELEANAVLHRRDYAFCLYPEALLRPFCTRFL
jgi:hypothetical protein